MLRSVAYCMTVMIFSSNAIASEQTYSREYTYKASEADSKISARAIALQEVKRELLNELGTHISALIKQQIASDGRQFGTEEIETLSAGVTSVQILEEKWDGVTYVLKAQIKADPTEVLTNLNKMLDVDKKQKQLSQLSGDLSKLGAQNIQIAESLTQSKKETNAALAEIAHLKKQLTEKQSGASLKKLKAAYKNQANSLSVNELVDSALKDYENEKYSDAFKSFKEAADKGHAVAQYSLGWMYGQGQGVPQDYAKAVKWYRLAAQQRNAGAQFNLGWMYDQGYGVQQDYAEAVKWYQLAALQGDAGAQFNLGWMYGQGQGVPQDYAEAVKWFRLAAQQGDAGAQYNLGIIYENGQGVQQDYAEAVKWYQLAAQQGHDKAQCNLGWMYGQGQGVPQDYAEAMKWYRLAAQQGLVMAQLNLGLMYAKGEGVTRDVVKAHLWFNLAATSGDASSVKNRDIAAGKMTPTQLAEAQKMARDCTANKLKGCN